MMALTSPRLVTESDLVFPHSLHLWEVLSQRKVLLLKDRSVIAQLSALFKLN